MQKHCQFFPPKKTPHFRIPPGKAQMNLHQLILQYIAVQNVIYTSFRKNAYSFDIILKIYLNFTKVFKSKIYK